MKIQMKGRGQFSTAAQSVRIGSNAHEEESVHLSKIFQNIDISDHQESKSVSIIG